MRKRRSEGGLRRCRIRAGDRWRNVRVGRARAQPDDGQAQATGENSSGAHFRQRPETVRGLGVMGGVHDVLPFVGVAPRWPTGPRKGCGGRLGGFLEAAG